MDALLVPWFYTLAAFPVGSYLGWPLELWRRSRQGAYRGCPLELWRRSRWGLSRLAVRALRRSLWGRISVVR